MKIYFRSIIFPNTNKPILFDYNEVENTATCSYRVIGTAKTKNKIKVNHYLEAIDGISIVDNQAVILDLIHFSAKHSFTRIKKLGGIGFLGLTNTNRLTYKKHFPKIDPAHSLLFECLVSQNLDPTLWSNTIGWRNNFSNKEYPYSHHYQIHTLTSLISISTHDNNKIIGSIKNTMLDQLSELFNNFLASAYYEIDASTEVYSLVVQYFQKTIYNLLTIDAEIYTRTIFENFTPSQRLDSGCSHEEFEVINQKNRMNYFKCLATMRVMPLLRLVGKNSSMSHLPSATRTILIQLRQVIQRDKLEIEALILSLEKHHYQFLAKSYHFNTVELKELKQNFSTHTHQCGEFKSFYILACSLIYPRIRLSSSTNRANLIKKITQACLDFLTTYHNTLFLPLINSTDGDFFVADELAELMTNQFNKQFTTAEEKFKNQSNEEISQNFYGLFCQCFHQQIALKKELLDKSSVQPELESIVDNNIVFC